MQIPDLQGKVALVTGSSTGIGAAVATAFGQQGMAVAVHCNRTRAEAEAVAAAIEAAGGRAIVLQGDVSDAARQAELVEETVAAFGRLDILVANAGSVVERKPIEQAGDDLYDQVMDLNARSVFVAARAAIPHLRAAGGGSIISTTSLAARNGGGGGSVLYAAAKGFVSSFTRGLAKEVARDRIRVNAVAPGVIMTPLQERLTPAKQIEAAIRLTPMRRTGTTDECVGAYLYLASDALSGFVTGQVIEVNGGIIMP
ncbi:3-oxoacyl-[acyl-carrier protein] reductase [Stella humosa]|uniref:3-oxoacyl-[acyl-carrier protein] reductase n=1 Tax=Stella humosa TaxID=94 RepID=A0A3N1KYQ8_9PROT|nr:SDR family NAD(P)-dependent oxidoreductase [Stella humosa]ROP83770.1 3-oxoacyl-[acyl-carrier protein] reductase [Stella humosa]BBK32969.1 oxidoreductase [Stella humosa]